MMEMASLRRSLETVQRDAQRLSCPSASRRSESIARSLLRTRSLLWCAILAAAAFGFLPSAAFAIPYYVQAQGYTNAFTGTLNNWSYIAGVSGGTGQLAQSSYPYSIDSSAYTPPESQTVSSSGAVAPGSIAFSSLATSSGGGGLAKTSVGLSWSDTISLQSSTLADGTSVNLVFFLSLSGNLGVSGDNNSANHIQDPSSADIAVTLSAGVSGANPIVVKGGILDGTQFGSTTAFPLGTYSMVGSSAIGSSFDLRSTVESYVAASSSQYSPSVQSLLNATADVWITSMTPGVDLVSSSGASYAPVGAVPEPGSCALLIGGIALMEIVARRKKCEGNA